MQLTGDISYVHRLVRLGIHAPKEPLVVQTTTAEDASGSESVSEADNPVQQERSTSSSASCVKTSITGLFNELQGLLVPTCRRQRLIALYLEECLKRRPAGSAAGITARVAFICLGRQLPVRQLILIHAGLSLGLARAPHVTSVLSQTSQPTPLHIGSAGFDARMLRWASEPYTVPGEVEAVLRVFDKEIPRSKSASCAMVWHTPNVATGRAPVKRTPSRSPSALPPDFQAVVDPFVLLARTGTVEVHQRADTLQKRLNVSPGDIEGSVLRKAAYEIAQQVILAINRALCRDWSLAAAFRFVEASMLMLAFTESAVESPLEHVSAAVVRLSKGQIHDLPTAALTLWCLHRSAVAEVFLTCFPKQPLEWRELASFADHSLQQCAPGSGALPDRLLLCDLTFDFVEVESSLYALLFFCHSQVPMVTEEVPCDTSSADDAVCLLVNLQSNLLASRFRPGSTWQKGLLQMHILAEVKSLLAELYNVSTSSAQIPSDCMRRQSNTYPIHPFAESPPTTW
ncbi:MAG: hypothetical protein KVP17_002843 [Porospora cf. gigantea B]|uniref:uncharacterized protein n=1 Tax=Porospora cf. gigantea B TaxID=2853592 RepID=UPI003571B6CA|nr:MAG: hypothetical protein KVP17_002843 [Porospora cf. gigantea B]